MKKIVKASIATTAGVILLLGGAGTFATWNSSATAQGASIMAGNLVVEGSQDAGTWTANGSAISIDDYRVVPGDVLTYTKTMKVGAEGDSLSATLALTDSSIAPADVTKPADVALASYLTDSAVLTASGAGITGSGPTFTVTPAGDVVSQDVTVTVTIAFPYGDVAGGNNAAMNGAVTLDELTVSLTQNTK
ncbi:alternate signal-mediated exported protein [Microbacterium trichothecenolyticum]|uniref:alternate-type signal peptide domain-containing protein n=1 Tax=Microbacterium trichothecenolyticum TaxID=69370 RepID=UPI00285FA05B|nr:alternate-type signal peptide domain-containing protein [Microbacterium trichothecenolyticum]MDR7185052.1 alternate signal-mediated exported protein [Microbacterium trichothecenolyticum]